MDPGQVQAVYIQKYSSPHPQAPLGEGGLHMTDVAFVVAAAAAIFFNERFLELR